MLAEAKFLEKLKQLGIAGSTIGQKQITDFSGSSN